MQSHTYRFSWRHLAQVVLPTFLCLAALAGALSLASRLHLLPTPAVGLNPETAIILHQSLASRTKSDAQILLVGDSTCLQGVDALSLGQQLPGQPPVLSLALFVGFDLRAYGEEVADFAAANPNQLRTVILLVKPLKLGGFGLGQYDQLWTEIHHPVHPPFSMNKERDWTGAQLYRRCLLSHVLATPLNGTGAEFYGFGSEIDAYLTRHRGSAAMPGQMAIPSRNDPSLPDYSRPWPLIPALEDSSRAFRALLPAGVKLCIGLTPTAAPYPQPAAQQRQVELLARWSTVIQADVLLTNLPATLPYSFFGPGNHLNPKGQQIFTARLARELTQLSK